MKWSSPLRGFLTIAICITLISAAPVAPTSGPAASKPVGARPGSYTEHDYRQELLAFNRRTLLEAYQSVGNHDPKWDAHAEKLLSIMALRFTNAPAQYHYILQDELASEDPLVAGQAAVDAGCTDPLVLYCYAAALDAAGRIEESEKFNRDAIDALYTSQYPLVRAAAAVGRGYNIAIKAKEADKAADYLSKQSDALLALAATWDFNAHPTDRRLIYDIFFDRDNLGVELQDSFYLDAKQLPDVDPWLLNMLGGDYHAREAQRARGGGWAREVKPEEWTRMFEQLKLARDCYVKAYRLFPRFPEPAGQLVYVGYLGDRELNESPKTWFDRMTAAQFDYPRGYDLKLNYLLPRWGGSHEELYRFGTTCLASGRFDTRVPWYYLRALEVIEWDRGDQEYWKKPGVYRMTKKYLDGTIAAVPTDRVRPVFCVEAMLYAYKSGEYADAAKYAEQAGSEAVDQYLDRAKILKAPILSEIAAYSGPHAEQLKAADRSMKSGKIADAARLLDERVAALTPDDPAALYIRHRATLASWEVKYASGDWVEVQPDTNLAGWRALGGDWSADATGRLTCMSLNGGNLIVDDDFVGRDYEFEGVITWEETKPVSAGPLWGLYINKWQSGVALRKHLQKVCMMADGDVVEEKPATFGQSATFHIKLQGPLLSVEVDGQPIYTDKDISSRLDASPQHVGVASYAVAADRPVHFSGLRIRKLKPLTTQEIQKRIGPDNGI